jgi:hypothetical protein
VAEELPDQVTKEVDLDLEKKHEEKAIVDGFE